MRLRVIKLYDRDMDKDLDACLVFHLGSFLYLLCGLILAKICPTGFVGVLVCWGSTKTFRSVPRGEKKKKQIVCDF